MVRTSSCHNTCLEAVLGCICGTSDLDKIFAYPTPRIVQIVDRRLGILHMFFMVAIMVFITVWQLARSGAYLAVSSPSGEARFRVTQPTTNCTYLERMGGSVCVTGCNPDQLNCSNSGGERGSCNTTCFNNVPNISDINYCSQSPSDVPYKHDKLLCLFQEYSSASVVYESSALIATRGHEYHQKKICSADHMDPLYVDGVCDRVYDTPRSTLFYYAHIGQFNVSLRHSMYHVPQDTGDPTNIKTSADMDGALYVPHNHALCRREGVDAVTGFPHSPARAHGAPCYIIPPAAADLADHFTLDTILGACDLDLDEAVDGQDEPLRYTGATLMVSITYSNWRLWEWPGSTSYIYKVQRAVHDYPHTTEAIYDTFPHNRTVFSRRGISIQAIQGGRLYNWDMATFLTTVTTSFALIAVARTITDVLAMYAMPDSERYRGLKYVVSQDFSEIRLREQSGLLEAAEGGGEEAPLLSSLLAPGADSLLSTAEADRRPSLLASTKESAPASRRPSAAGAAQDIQHNEDPPSAP